MPVSLRHLTTCEGLCLRLPEVGPDVSGGCLSKALGGQTNSFTKVFTLSPLNCAQNVVKGHHHYPPQAQPQPSVHLVIMKN